MQSLTRLDRSAESLGVAVFPSGQIAKAKGANCQDCPGRDRSLVPPEPARNRCQLAIVGEAPGLTEIEKKRPFVGASGRLLMSLLAKQDLRRADVHFTNAILCDVKKKDLPKARKCCAERLKIELTAANPPVIAPVGAYALQSVLGRGQKPKIMGWRGFVIETNPPLKGGSSDRKSDVATSRPGPELSSPKSYDMASYDSSAPGPAPIYVAPSVHPAFALSLQKWLPVLELDFERIARLRQRPFVRPEHAEGRRVIVAQSEHQALELVSQLGPVASFDVETTYESATTNKLICFALSDGGLTVVIPWSKDRQGLESWRGFGALAQDLSAELVRRVIVTHNGPSFDHIVAERHGLKIGQWEDTLFLYHALHGERPKSLAHVVSVYLDAPPWKEETQGARSESLEELWAYNGLDACYTFLAYEALTKELSR